MRVLGMDGEDPHCFGVALKWCRDSASTFRSDEWRKVAIAVHT